MQDIERARIIDDEHLRLLRIAYLCHGYLALFFSVFPLFHIAFGLAMALGAFPHPEGAKGSAPPPAVGYVFAGFGIAIFIAFVTKGVLDLLVARALGQRRKHLLCFVDAIATTLWFPYGTMLGIATLMVLNRDSVKGRFDTVDPVDGYR